MNRGRAYRRHQSRRCKARVLTILRLWGWGSPGEPTPRWVGIALSTHCKPCSCWCCGNRRPHEGPTLAERIAELGEVEEKEETL